MAFPNTRNLGWIHRVCALAVALSLGLPAPAWALRQTGMEESNTRDEMEDALLTVRIEDVDHLIDRLKATLTNPALVPGIHASLRVFFIALADPRQEDHNREVLSHVDARRLTYALMASAAGASNPHFRDLALDVLTPLVSCFSGIETKEGVKRSSLD